jgi:hypothetical protein
VFSVRSFDTPRKRGTQDERKTYRTIVFGLNQTFLRLQFKATGQFAELEFKHLVFL